MKYFNFKFNSPHLITNLHHCKEISEFPIAFEVLFDTLKKIFNAPKSMEKDLKLQSYLR